MEDRYHSDGTRPAAEDNVSDDNEDERHDSLEIRTVIANKSRDNGKTVDEKGTQTEGGKGEGFIRQ